MASFLNRVSKLKQNEQATNKIYTQFIHDFNQEIKAKTYELQHMQPENKLAQIKCKLIPITFLDFSRCTKETFDMCIDYLIAYKWEHHRLLQIQLEHIVMSIILPNPYCNKLAANPYINPKHLPLLKSITVSYLSPSDLSYLFQEVLLEKIRTEPDNQFPEIHCEELKLGYCIHKSTALMLSELFMKETETHSFSIFYLRSNKWFQYTYDKHTITPNQTIIPVHTNISKWRLDYTHQLSNIQTSLRKQTLASLNDPPPPYKAVTTAPLFQKTPTAPPYQN